MPIPVVDLSGEPAERGLRHGRALQGEIRHCLEIYRRALHSTGELRRCASEIVAEVRRYVPDFALEMEGIAKGARVEPWRIQVLNARSARHRDFPRWHVSERREDPCAIELSSS